MSTEIGKSSLTILQPKKEETAIDEILANAANNDAQIARIVELSIYSYSP